MQLIENESSLLMTPLSWLSALMMDLLVTRAWVTVKSGKGQRNSVAERKSDPQRRFHATALFCTSDAEGKQVDADNDARFVCMGTSNALSDADDRALARVDCLRGTVNCASYLEVKGEGRDALSRKLPRPLNMPPRPHAIMFDDT